MAQMPLRAWNADLVQALRAKAGNGVELVGHCGMLPKRNPRCQRGKQIWNIHEYIIYYTSCYIGTDKYKYRNNIDD